MAEDELPDFLRVNRFGAKPGMFGAARPRAETHSPFSGPMPRVGDQLTRTPALSNGTAEPGPSPFSHAFLPPAPAAQQCRLVPLDPVPGTVAANGQDLRFSPAFAELVRKAAETLNRKGIRLDISNGFRTAADQLRMRKGGSGRNPAARYSDHQLGNAIDLNGTMLSTFPAIVQAFKKAGARWGGDYRAWKDRPHFYIRPVTANGLNTAECERENPR